MTWTPGSPINLDTERFTLRGLLPNDATDDMAAWYSDPEVLEFLDMPAGISRDEMARFVGNFDGKDFLCIGIFDKSTGKCVGYYQVYLTRKNASARTNVVIGDKSYWGKGVVVETRARLLDFLFEEAEVRKVWGMMYARNIAAIFNYQKQGFTPEGVMRQEWRDRHGNWQDAVRFGLLKEDWLAGREDGS